MYYIGIDLGTSAMKLLLMDEKGEIYRTVTEEYPLSFPHPGWSEQEPADWIRALKTGLSDLLEGYDASQVRAIGSGGQMHGLVALDENDEIIRPAILWNDGRTDRETEYLNSAIGKEVLSEATGNIAFAGFTAPKLLWMRENEPELFEKIDKIMLPKDYINYVLTGKHATDYSDASGMLLLDVKNRAWSDKMKDLCGLREEQLAGLFESYEPIGSLKPELAAELGLPETVLVAAGAGDNAAAAVGTGVLKEGTCSISIGTSGTVFIACDAFCTDPQNSLHAFAHADGRWHLMGCMLSAGSCNNWFMKDILYTDNFSEEQAGITDEMLGRNRVYFLPYLMGKEARSMIRMPAAALSGCPWIHRGRIWSWPSWKAWLSPSGTAWKLQKRWAYRYSQPGSPEAVSNPRSGERFLPMSSTSAWKSWQVNRDRAWEAPCWP